MPVRRPPGPPQISIEVVDVDQNRQLTSQDHYFYHAPDGGRHQISPAQALKLLNFIVDPTTIKKNGWGMLVHTSDVAAKPIPGQKVVDLDVVQGITPAQREGILDSYHPYWEADGHLDMSILGGLRLYTDAENHRWTGPRGIGIYFGWKSAFKEVFVHRVFTIGGAFQGLEHFVSPAFTWHMFTNNFFSMVGGSFSSNTRLEGNIEAWTSMAKHPDASESLRRVANIQTAEARAKVAKDHLRMTYTWSVVLAACFADPNFRKFWPAPWRFPRPGILYNHFSNQFRTTIPALGRNPMGWGLALSSGFGLYEISKAWFDMYGGLRYNTTENRLFSAASTVLIEGALISTASKEMMAYTGSGELTLANFRKISTLNRSFSLGLAIEPIPVGEKLWRFSPNRLLAKLDVQNRLFKIPEGYRLTRFNFFGLKTPLPRPSIIATWKIPGTALPSVAPTAAASVEGATLSESATVLEFPTGLRAPALPSLAQTGTLAAEGGVLAEGATATRLATASRVAATETVLSRVAVTTLEGRTFAVRVLQGLTAEEMMARGNTRVFGIPLLYAAAGLGIAIGFGYVSGYYGDHRTPRDTFREIFGQ